MSSEVATFRFGKLAGDCKHKYAILHAGTRFIYGLYKSEELKRLEAECERPSPESIPGVMKMYSPVIDQVGPHHGLSPDERYALDPGQFYASEHDVAQCQRVALQTSKEDEFKADFLLLLRTRSFGPSPLDKVKYNEYMPPFVWALMVIREGDLAVRRATIILMPNELWMAARRTRQSLKLI